LGGASCEGQVMRRAASDGGRGGAGFAHGAAAAGERPRQRRRMRHREPGQRQTLRGLLGASVALCGRAQRRGGAAPTMSCSAG
jgi:hypothetical protein